MKIVVLYNYPIEGGIHDEVARRFVASYKQHPAGHEHELIVSANGGPQTDTMEAIFAGIPLRWFPNDGIGWDIGTYLKVARSIPADMMVFFGGNTHLNGANWLKRMASVFKRDPFACYGATANNGRKQKKDAAGNIRKRAHHPHIRTTGFWMDPKIIAAYPHPVTSEQRTRYLFEHGPKCLTAWLWSRKHKCYCVTWTGQYDYPHWEGITNGYRNGDESQVIVGDRCTFLLNKAKGYV